MWVKTLCSSTAAPLTSPARDPPRAVIEPARLPQQRPLLGPLWAIYGYRADVAGGCGLAARLAAGAESRQLEQLRRFEAWHPRGHLPRYGEFPLGDTAEQLEQPGPLALSAPWVLSPAATRIIAAATGHHHSSLP